MMTKDNIQVSIKDCTPSTPHGHLCQETKFRLAVDASPNAMVMVDSEGRIELFNLQAERLFGYRQDDILGQPIEVLIPPAARAGHPNLRKQFHAAPETRQMGLQSSELLALHREGYEIPVEIGLNPVSTDDGDFVLIAIVDISERRQMEAMQQQLHRDIAESNEALRQSNLKLQQFASIASHDLQAPLRHISGLVQLLLVNYADQLDGKANELINRTVQSVQTLQSLIDDLLSFSRMESRVIHKEPVALHKVFGESVEMLSSAIQESNADIQCGYLPEVLADRSMMIHVFQNLMANSIKYRSNETPRILIESDEQPESWVIRFHDNGMGIDPRHHSKIFEVFQRLHSEPSLKGNGLGLAICKSILNRHGGDIEVDSSPGHGACFSILLPKFDLT